jgi:hypothetical protein
VTVHNHMGDVLIATALLVVLLFAYFAWPRR